MDEETEPNLLRDIGELQRVVNIGLKQNMREKYPHISPDWYEIHINPSLKYDIASYAGAVVQIHTRLIPTIHASFKEDLKRAIRNVPRLRTPMQVERYVEVMDRRSHWEIRRLAVSDEELGLIPVARVEYRVITRVVARHLDSNVSVEVESDIYPIHALKQQAHSLLSHKVRMELEE